jgi:DNA polymerase-1
MNKDQKNKLVLLDMHAILHRGYHALPDFETSDGQPTGALFGLYTMLLSIIDTLDPTYIIGCYDLAEPTVRHQMFAQYKAGRKETDPELKAQLQTSREVLESFGITYLESGGFEADDLLGTVVTQLQDDLQSGDLEIVIASGDHDTLQLVQGSRVRVYAMRRGIKDTVLYDEDKVIDRYGFKPALLADYKGLRGDPSDNIPGIAGVGEKTATKLITEFGSLENILQIAAKNPEKLAELKIRKGIIAKLQSESATAEFSKELATIRLDAPISISLKQATWRDNLEPELLIAKTKELQFRSLVVRLRKQLGLETKPDGEVDKDQGSLFSVEAAETESSKVDEELLDEAKLMLWLLDSDQTNPSASEIQRASGSDDLKSAHQILRDKISKDQLDRVYEEIEKPLLPVIANINSRGIVLDQKFLASLEKDYSKKLGNIQAKIYQIVGHEFNISSPKQLGEVLFDELKLPKKGIKKTSTGNFSTAESELEKLRDSHEVIELILGYRELSKLINTYIAALPKLVDDDGRLRATFVQWGTTTGRMSSRAPNLQNIPVRSELGSPIRQAFVAQPGYQLVAIDYSQIELRIAAWLSGDDNLKKVFNSGDDIHASVAADMFEVEIDEVTKDMRSTAKTINYGILYGMGANALRINLNQGSGPEITKQQAINYLDRYFEAFPDLAGYQDSIKRSVKKNGYTTTFYGRRRYFNTIKSKLPYLRAQAERMAINAPIQGTQADIIKLAMVQVSKWIDKNKFDEDVFMLLQVHDELVFAVKEDKVDKIVPQLKSIMENVIDLDETGGIKMIADAKVGQNWLEMKEYE